MTGVLFCVTLRIDSFVGPEAEIIYMILGEILPSTAALL